MNYVRTLQFDEEPDYTYMRGLVQQVADQFGFSCNDRIFDWSVIKEVTEKGHG